MIPTRLLRRPRVVIVGFGDVAARTIPLLVPRYRVVAMRRNAIRPESGAENGKQRPAQAGPLTAVPTKTAATSIVTDAARGAGRTAVAPQRSLAGTSATRVVPIAGDLDARRSLKRAAALAASAFGVLYFAPPPPEGAADPRTRRWIAAVSAAKAGRARQAATRRFGGIVPERTAVAASRGPYALLRVVYASTSGVYGDCGGAAVTETRPVAPSNARAVRRVDAERQWRATPRRNGVKGHAGPRHAVSILRIPGIYAADRLPVSRLREGMPALRESDDVYTNHIQADDLAAIAVRTLTHGRPQRLYHASDDSRLRMGDYFDTVADALQLPRPPRLAREAAVERLSPAMWSFMRESRQLDNARLHRELGVRLRYPDVDALLATLVAKAP
jgi:dTDP-4-dehydrorhamnose reductase